MTNLTHPHLSHAWPCKDKSPHSKSWIFSTYGACSAKRIVGRSCTHSERNCHHLHSSHFGCVPRPVVSGQRLSDPILEVCRRIGECIVLSRRSFSCRCWVRYHHAERPKQVIVGANDQIVRFTSVKHCVKVMLFDMLPATCGR